MWVVKEASLMLVTGGAVGLMERAVMGGEQEGKTTKFAACVVEKKTSSLFLV
jgi:hypothetical protein